MRHSNSRTDGWSFPYTFSWRLQCIFALRSFLRPFGFYQKSTCSSQKNTPVCLLQANEQANAREKYTYILSIYRRVSGVFLLPFFSPTITTTTTEPRADALPTANRTIWLACIRTPCTTSGWRLGRSAARAPQRHRFRCAPNSTVRYSTSCPCACLCMRVRVSSDCVCCVREFASAIWVRC